MISIIKLTYKGLIAKIELDDGEKLSLPYEIASMFSLHSGKEISPTEYKQLKEESERFQCKEKALSYLALRNRSNFEMIQYLKKKRFSEYLINETVTRLKEAGYINDYTFAVAYIQNRMKRKTMGKDLLVKELYQKGISKKLINKAIHETSADIIDYEEVFIIAKKKYESLKNKKNKKEKTGNFLRQRGFDFTTIRKVINDLEDEPEDI